MNFTLVSTVFNEAKRLSRTIDDLKAQILQPSEIIITDAGSTDGTYEMLMEWARVSTVPIIILQKHRCNVAEGRNMAIRAAKYELIASMDFGCRFLPDWLSTLMAPFADPNVEIVGGAFAVEETEQISLPAKADYILANGYKLNVHAGRFIPSSRSIAYKKSVFDRINGYCEWLTLAGDDMVFGLQVKANKYDIVNVEKPCVFWGRHKTTKAFVKEMFRYGLGNGEARIGRNQFFRYILDFVSRILFVIAFLFSLVSFVHDGEVDAIPLIVMVLTVYFFRPYANYLKKWVQFRSSKYNLKVLFFGFYFYERLKLGYIDGYIKGYFFSNNERKTAALQLKTMLQY
jgi:glycosyltransferase involved in cell wall biosynthesis